MPGRMHEARGARFRVRGQDAARAAVGALLERGTPHALLVVGPPSSGKTTLALDVAATLLCEAPASDERPCRECRGCRLVEAGNHPDLHRLVPIGPARQIGIGTDDQRGVRHLIRELALLPVEGGARVAIIEGASRLTEEAQNALLKTLEEPPARSTLILCADEAGELLPTVRSRCAQVRLGPVGSREIEAFLVERGVADAPTAARLARISGGRPGFALTLALAPDAVAARGEIARSLLDVLRSGRTARLALVRALLGRAMELNAALAQGMADPSAPTGAAGSRAGGPARRRATAPAPATGERPDQADGSPGDATDTGDGATTAGAAEAPLDPPGDGAAPSRGAPAERRAAALTLLGIWRDLARDLLVLGRGGRSRLADPALLDELEAAVGGLDPAELARFLDRLDRTARLIDGNVGAELALDVLVLAWPGGGATEAGADAAALTRGARPAAGRSSRAADSTA